MRLAGFEFIQRAGLFGLQVAVLESGAGLTHMMKSISRAQQEFGSSSLFVKFVHPGVRVGQTLCGRLLPFDGGVVTVTAISSHT
jgi:hypothetical protein